MTYVVDTGVATLRHNQNHPGSVPIPARGIPARPAPENPFPESEALLGLDQVAFGGGARPQPVGVAHHLGPHARHANRHHRPGSQACIITSLKGGRRFLSLVNEGVSAPNIR